MKTWGAAVICPLPLAFSRISAALCSMYSYRYTNEILGYSNVCEMSLHNNRLCMLITLFLINNKFTKYYVKTFNWSTFRQVLTIEVRLVYGLMHHKYIIGLVIPQT